MTSRIQAFDTTGNRLIDNEPAPGAGVTHWNGFDGDVTGTLRNIFDFGTSDDPVADNGWTMGYGTRSFQSQNLGAGSFHIVDELFFENFATQGDPRVGADIIVRSPGPILSTGFRTDSVYLAGFGFLVPDTVEFVDRGMITGDLDPTRQTGALYWASRHLVSYFFGNDPVSLPAPPDERKQVAYAADDLWFGGNFANGVREARLLSGWGQEFLYTRPQHNGVTPALIGVMTDADLAADAAGDGIGLWFLFGDPGHEDNSRIRGMFNAYTTTVDPFGPWALELDVWDGAAIAVAATFDPVTRTAQVFGKQIATTEASSIGVVQGFKTASFSALVTGFHDVAMPLKAGKIFIPTGGRLMVETRDAALTTFPSFALAQNGVDVSTVATTVGAQFNSFPAPAALATGATTVNGNLDMTTFPLQLHVVAAAAGAGLTTLNAHWEIFGYYE